MGRPSFEVTKQYLATQHLAPLLHASSQQLQTLNKWSTAGQALRTLGSSNILSAPVLDEDQEYYGCLSVNDLLKDIMRVLQAQCPDYYEKISSLTEADMLKLGEEFCKHSVDKLQHAGDLWLLNTDDQSTLLDAVLESFRIQDATVHHRLYVCCNAHEQKSNTVQKTTVVNITPGSERLSATGLKVTHVVSQSDVVKLLWGNKTVLSDVLAASVEELELDAGAVFTIAADAPALEAFSKMARDHKSALGVTDPKTGRLIGNISVSDIRGLAPEDFPQLLKTAGDYALVHHGQPASQGGDYTKAFAALPVVTVTASSTFETVLELLSTKNLHRVYVVDAEGKPTSVITLTDVLRKVTKAPVEPLPQRVVAMEEEEDSEEDDEEEAAA